MAYLPPGFADEVAKAEATIQRGGKINDGDYVLLHKALLLKTTQKGEAIIIEHKIIEAKATAAGVEPTPVGTNYGYFLPRYGEAAVMCKPNLKAYAVAMFGADAKKWTETECAARVNAMGDARQECRGMLIRGVTFHTDKKNGEDFMGMNWYPISGENVVGSPSVLKRRAELDASEGAPDAGAAAPANGASGAPPPFPGNGPDPLAGWTPYPGRPGWFYQGQQVKSEADLRAGK